MYFVRSFRRLSIGYTAFAVNLPSAAAASSAAAVAAPSVLAAPAAAAHHLTGDGEP